MPVGICRGTTAAVLGCVPMLNVLLQAAGPPSTPAAPKERAADTEVESGMGLFDEDSDTQWAEVQQQQRKPQKLVGAWGEYAGEYLPAQQQQRGVKRKGVQTAGRSPRCTERCA